MYNVIHQNMIFILSGREMVEEVWWTMADISLL